MNFKILSFLLSFLFLTGCGVKGDPINPPGTELKDWYEKYTFEKTEKSQKK